MSTDKKYYWLKLKRDFFKRHDIRIIESMPNGKDYVLFYLKLLVESVDHDGQLRFNDTIPYNEQMLSTITNTNVDIVRSAMKVFTDLNMIDVLENQTIYMTEVSKMLGSETFWAETKRIQRTKNSPELLGQSLDNVLSMSKMSKEEKETEKELDIDKEKKKKGVSFVDYTDNPDLVSALNDFLSMRKKIKSPMTDKAITLILNGLDKLADDDQTKIDILNQSIMNGWKGVFSLKDQKTGQQRVPKGIQELQEYKRQLQEQQRGEGHGRI